MTTSVKVSLGEIVDKLSILDIKKRKIKHIDKLEHINREFEELSQHVDVSDKKLATLYEKLIHINGIIWNVEDSLHKKEIDKTFDNEFIKLARTAYSTNDIRFQIKNEINKNSELKEQKGYNESSVTKPELLLLTHQGIGDIMISNGLIRHYSENHRVIIGTKPEYLKNVQFMFRDIHDLRIFTAPNDEILRYLARTQFNNIPSIGLGYFRGQNFGADDLSDENFCKSFYIDANVNFEYMYSKFFILRDFQREQSLYDEVVKYLNTDKYIVIHDCPGRGIYIDDSLVDCPPGVAKLYIGKDRCPIQGDTIFDYRMVLEKCVAFHGFNSNFPFVIDLWNIPVKTKVIHIYPRHTDKEFATKYHKAGWLSIDKPTV
jgi:hypothetical protein